MPEDDMAAPLRSAQVLLRAADGRNPPAEGLTTKTLAAYAPARRDVEQVMRYFHDAGFTVGGLVANNFSITAPVATFEGAFDCTLRCECGRILVAGDDDGYKLPDHALPARIRGLIVAVAFSAPPDFGPVEFGDQSDGPINFDF